MIINLIHDSSIAGAPSDFMAAVEAAALIFEQTFTDPITINITVGWGTLNNVPLPNKDFFVAVSNAAYATPDDPDPDPIGSPQPVAYSMVRQWLAAKEPNYYLPPDNDGVDAVLVSRAELKALDPLFPQNDN